MAIYHLSAQVISRSSGRSCVAAAAYRSSEKLHDEHLGKTMDYSMKSGVEHSEIMAPENAPDWVHDRSNLWNAVEAFEKRKDAQLAREIQVGLPKELSKEAQVELVRSYVRDSFVKEGMVADFSIHKDNPENPHAHVMLTMREVSENGFGPKNREWNSPNYLIAWRENWAREANIALDKEHHEQRIDHRSYAEQGIQIEPTKKIGVSLDRLETDGRDIVRERMREHQEIARRNGESILETPEIALHAITHQQAAFTKVEVGRWLNTRTADREQFQACLEKCMASEQLVQLGKDGEGRDRFTTQEMLQVERRIQENSTELRQQVGHPVNDKFVGQAEANRTLDPEQAMALKHITQETGDIAVVEGYAGTGKSYMLGAAREAWEAQGYQVKGAALAGKAAEGLEASSGISSRSIHAWEYAWKEGRDRLSSKDVLVIDEAGMVGSRQMGRVLEHAKESGAKVVLVGDTEQLQAIEAGSPMRLVGREIGEVTLGEIRRQREGWQREASKDFATEAPEKGLKAYEEKGHIRSHATQSEALQSIVKAWDEYRKDSPRNTQIMLAYRRDEVRDLNERARAIRKDAGELGMKDFKVETERGPREFAAGDRVYFLKNDRQLQVKNGTLGTIEVMKENQAVIRLDSGEGTKDQGGGSRRVVVDFEQYNHLDHGYAATVHKSQGVTVDRAQVLASELFDRHSTYVGMTRHRDGVDLHWSKEEFMDKAQLYKTLSRARPKELAVDFEKAVEDNRQLTLSKQGKQSTEGDQQKQDKSHDGKSRVLDGTVGQARTKEERMKKLEGMFEKAREKGIDRPSAKGKEKGERTKEDLMRTLDEKLEKAKSKKGEKDREVDDPAKSLDEKINRAKAKDALKELDEKLEKAMGKKDEKGLDPSNNYKGREITRDSDKGGPEHEL